MAGVTLGDFEIAHIRAATYWWDGGSFFGVVPKTMWSRRAPSDDLNRIQVAFNSYIIRTGGHTVLIETGGGAEKLEERVLERMNLRTPVSLTGVLERQGVDPAEIDIVINSHLHWDHCSGNTKRTDAGPLAAFPRARYFASRPEWEHAHERHVRDSVSYLDENYDPLVESGQMTLVDGDYEVLPGIRMVPAPGHNRDMMAITAESRGETFCFLSDMVPTVAHLQPTWVAAVDLYPLQAIDTKTEWLGRAAQDNWLCGFGHDASVGFARIEMDSKTQFKARTLLHC